MAIRVRIDERGALTVPNVLREAAGIKTNTTVFLEIEGDGIRLCSFHSVFKRVRSKLRRRVRGDGIVDELIRDRRTGRS